MPSDVVQMCLLGKRGRWKGRGSDKEWAGNSLLSSASNSSSWTSDSMDVRTHTHTNAYTAKRDFLHSALPVLQRTSEHVPACVAPPLPANQVGFGFLCQFADTPFWGGAKGYWWVLKQQLPLLLLGVLLHVPGWPSTLVTCAHGPSCLVACLLLLLRRFFPAGSLGLERRRALFVGPSAAPPQWRGLRWLRRRSRFLDSHHSGPATPSRRRRHARVRQHFLCRRHAAFVACRRVDLVVRGEAPAAAALSCVLRLLLALPASLLARWATSRSWRAGRGWDLWWTHWRLCSRLPPPSSHT